MYDTPDITLGWFGMGMGLFGGLAIFLFGMEQLSDALKATMGASMKTLLVKLTGNRVLAATTGAFVTAVIQSSSVTTVLIVGFVSAGIMSMQQSIGIIMGANVGTTLTAQIVAFKINEYALLLVAGGYAALSLAKADRVRQYGQLAMGLGLIFFGMGIMSDSMAPLRHYQPFVDLMISMQKPLFGIFVAAAFTALVQSSSATTSIVIVMASQGFVSLPAGIAMALGANIGTCVTALLAALGKPTEAIRAAVVHVFFNVAGVLIWLGLIDQLAALAVWLSPTTHGLTEVQRLAAETPRQIANANTAFNLINTILFLFFTGTIARIVMRLVPERSTSEQRLVEPKFLDAQLLDTPALALNAVRLEIRHMGELVQQMLENLTTGLQAGTDSALDQVLTDEKKLGVLQKNINDYLSDIQLQSLPEAQANVYQQLVSATAYVELAGDVLSNELTGVVRQWIGSSVNHKKQPNGQFNDLLELVSKAMHGSIESLVRNDPKPANDVIAMQDHIDDTIAEIHKQLSRFQMSRAEMDAFGLTVEITEKLRRSYSLSKRIARGVLEQST